MMIMMRIMMRFGDLRKLIRAGVPGEGDHGEPGGGAQSGPARHGVRVEPE